MLKTTRKFKSISLTREYDPGVFVTSDEYERYKSNREWAIRDDHAHGHIEYLIDIELTKSQLSTLIKEAQMEEEEELIDYLKKAEKSNNVLKFQYQTEDYETVETFYEMAFHEATQAHNIYVPMYYFKSFVEIDSLVRKAIDIDLKYLDLDVAFREVEAA